MTDRLKLVRRVAGDLRAEEIFEKAAGAVYMVKADKSIGSAVAVSESDLLTNCHVVGDKTQVLLVRDRQELKATVVSMNVNADRCVLRVESKLPNTESIAVLIEKNPNILAGIFTIPNVAHPCWSTDVAVRR